MMKRLRDGLGSLLVMCIVIRLAAWLVAPALPLIVLLLIYVAIFMVIFGRGGRL